MMICDYTPAHLAPLPWQRVLMAVRMVINELWSANKGTLEVRTETRDDLLLAARYYDKRKKFLERDGGRKKMWIFKINRLSLSGRVKYHLLHTLLFAGWVVFLGFARSLLFVNNGLSHVENHSDLILHVLGVVQIGFLYYLLCSALTMSSPKIDPKAELAEIADFESYLPSVFSMARYEEPTPSVLSAIRDSDDPAHCVPVVPPGLTELLLAKDSHSLHAIRMQLRTTRRIDIGMTLVSFGAFVTAIALCFSLLIVTDRMAQGLMGIGGSGLAGLFCFYYHW